MNIFTPETAVECANYAYDRLRETHPHLPTVFEMHPRRRSWFLVTALGVGELVSQPNGPIGPDSVSDELAKRGLDEVDADITLSMIAFYVNGDYVDLPVTSIGNAISQTSCFCDRHDVWLRPASELFDRWLTYWKTGRDIPLSGPEFERAVHAAATAPFAMPSDPRVSLTGPFSELKDETIIIPPGNPMTIPVPHVEPVGFFMREVARQEYAAAVARNAPTNAEFLKKVGTSANPSDAGTHMIREMVKAPGISAPQEEFDAFYGKPPVEDADDPQKELILRMAKRLRDALYPHTAYQRETEVKSWRGNGLIVTTSYTVGGTLLVEVKSDREEKDDGEEP